MLRTLVVPAVLTKVLVACRCTPIAAMALAVGVVASCGDVTTVESSDSPAGPGASAVVGSAARSLAAAAVATTDEFPPGFPPEYKVYASLNGPSTTVWFTPGVAGAESRMGFRANRARQEFEYEVKRNGNSILRAPKSTKSFPTSAMQGLIPNSRGKLEHRVKFDVSPCGHYLVAWAQHTVWNEIIFNGGPFKWGEHTLPTTDSKNQPSCPPPDPDDQCPPYEPDGCDGSGGGSPGGGGGGNLPPPYTTCDVLIVYYKDTGEIIYTEVLGCY